MESALQGISAGISETQSSIKQDSEKLNDRIDYYFGYDPAKFELSLWAKFKGSLGI